MLNMTWYTVIQADWRHQLLVLYHDNRLYYWVAETFCVMFCAAIIPRIALIAYWTCQLTFSWVCESPPCFERPYHSEQLTASPSVHRLKHQCRVHKDLFSREQKHSILRRGSWLLDGGSGRRKQMLVLEQHKHVLETVDPDSAHEQREREMFAFEMWVSNGGRAIKTIRPEPSLEVKARRLSDKHMCCTSCVWRRIYCYSYMLSSIETSTTTPQFFTLFI